MKINGHLTLPPTAKLYFDDGGDTYIQEEAADTLSVYTGGVRRFQVATASVTFESSVNVNIAATKRLYLDGGSDTYLHERAANVLNATVGGVSRVDISTAAMNIYLPIDATAFKTTNGSTGSIAHGTWATIHTPSTVGLYLYHGYYPAGGYNGYALVGYNSSSANLLIGSSGGLINFQISGSSVQMNQASGTTVGAIYWTVMRIY